MSSNIVHVEWSASPFVGENRVVRKYFAVVNGVHGAECPTLGQAANELYWLLKREGARVKLQERGRKQ